MAEHQSERFSTRSSTVMLAALALITFALHAATNHRYGFHHDEFYFIACGQHLAAGYVDHPPLTPLIARVSIELFGVSVRGLRFFPAVAGALTVFLTGVLTRRLGGGLFAQAVAAIAFMIAPVYLRSGNILAIPSFEPLFWVLGFYVVTRIIQEGNPKLWLWVGLICGIGLLNKHTMLFFGFALTVGLALTPLRKHFKSPWLYACGVLALLIFLPNLVWQATHDWATLGFVQNLNKGTMSQIPAIMFFLGQILYEHPVSFPLWLGGILFFLLAKDAKPYRIFGIMYVTLFLLLATVGSKIYYLAPMYPVLFAGGAVAWQRIIERRDWRWARPATLAALAVGGLAFVPLSLPMLPIQTTDRYVNGLTFGALGNVYEITGDLHGQFGWYELVAGVADVYNTLSEEEKADCIIFASSYGKAGAIDLLGDAHGLPNATSTHMTYHLWGPGNENPSVVIAVGLPAEMLSNFFHDIDDSNVVTLENTNPWDAEILVAICRNPIKPIGEVWSELGGY